MWEGSLSAYSLTHIIQYRSQPQTRVITEKEHFVKTKTSSGVKDIVVYFTAVLQWSQEA